MLNKYQYVKALLEHIESPNDLRKLSPDQLPLLAKELREFIIDIVSAKEGHLGASLGVVELTIALHYLYNTPEDKLIWDVGHQAYGHKILTERKSRFYSNRQLNGLSGFPKMEESVFDDFGTGHSSTSISALLGIALSAKLKGLEGRQHIAVIGDASIASGMAFEGLNHAGVTNTNILVILNDNAMGIDPSVGALKKYLTNVKIGAAKDENIFECLNFNYTGPIDGHDFNKLILELNRLKNIKGPKLLHVITTKGKGLKKAEENQITYHAPGKFNKKTGELQKKSEKPEPPKFQDVFGKTIVELALKNKKIVGITPAMPTGSSLKFMMEEIPDRAFDVGIAEQHAVTMAAGMAADGLVPFCNIYSTFLQRAYDQVIHDVALQNLPVIFCLDRSGLVGEDGPTHHGVFDISYLRCIPNLIICSPINEIELRNIMFTAQFGLQQPIAIRYPRGRGSLINWQKPMHTLEIGKAYQLKSGSTIAILSTGPIGNMITNLIHDLDNDSKIAHYNFPFIKPLDIDLLQTIFQNHKQIITIEDGAAFGGFGTSILEISNSLEINKNIKIFGIPDKFITHGSTQELHKIAGIDKLSVKKYVQQFL